MTPGRAIVALTRERPRIAATWYAVLFAFAARSVAMHDERVWAYLTLLTILTAILAVTERAVGFSDRALCLLLAAGTLHLCGGLLPGWGGHVVLYDSWIVPDMLRADQVIHTFGSAAATVAMWEVIGVYANYEAMRPRTQALLAGLASLGKGALNEVMEFLMALAFADSYAGGYTNTGWDLTFNFLGATCAGILLVASGARRRPAPRKARVARPASDDQVLTPVMAEGEA